ncbi:hypothetical protein J7889_04560 [Mycoplasmopsis agalactiae]|nr:hypothetical protein [Mycoplasmopsis agalactiae]MCE6056805.1 hypothetical protein [Mycoplasmopsis agalactiae]
MKKARCFGKTKWNKAIFVCPVLNKETKEIIFSALPVYDLSSTNHIPKVIKKVDEESFKQKVFLCEKAMKFIELMILKYEAIN